MNDGPGSSVGGRSSVGDRSAVGGRSSAGDGSRRSAIDRGLYALFARHADDRRHDVDRKRYRGTDIHTGFDSYLSRTYALSWVLSLGTLGVALIVVPPIATSVHGSVETVLSSLRFWEPTDRIEVSEFGILAALSVGVAITVKHLTIRLGGLYLRWIAAARRTDIERTLPGAVRYLEALSNGSDDTRTVVRKVAKNDAYGASAVSLRKVINTARLTGSLDEGLRRVARDTPSRDLLAPFLLKFREHANRGETALSEYLRMEGRMLRYRQDRARKRAEGYLELLAELFIVVLVLPALLVIVLTVMSVLAPGLSRPVWTPVGSVSTRALVVYGSAAFVLVVGFAGAVTVETIRPTDQRIRHPRPDTAGSALRTALHDPMSAMIVFACPALAVGSIAAYTGVSPVNAGLFAYVAFAVPVGAVSVRRSRIDDAKDREMTDFVHAVAGHVSLGRPFPEAIAIVARDVDLGALNVDVADLAFTLSLTTAGVSGPDPGDIERRAGGIGVAPVGVDGKERVETEDVRTAALERFVERVGTPLADQTVGLVTGALNAGSDAEAVFETLQTEIGQLYHEKQALRSAMLVYVAVGWTTALLVVGIVVAINTQVIDGFAQLSELSGTSGFALDPDAIRPERERGRLYVVTQATMLASGWFAGVASRGPFEALLHSGLLVAACYAVFAGGGMI